LPPLHLLGCGEGRTISRLGDSFYTVALALWVLEKTHSAATMSLVLVCSTVPMLVLLLLGGVFVDRFSRLLIMLTSDALRAVIVGLIAVQAASGLLEVWHVLGMSVLFGIADAFFSPAASAVVPDLVETSDQSSANALRSISGNLMGIVGPALAGWVMATAGPASAFALDSLSFVISAFCLLKIAHRSALRKAGEGKGSVLADLGEGIQTIVRSPWLWITIAIAGISNITLT
jgi:MFS family permease